jgi:hypothetical protein
MRRILVVVGVGYLSILPMDAAAQQTTASARLRVIDGVSGKPLEGATVTFPDLRVGSISDGTGAAVIAAIPAGDHSFEVVMPGYGKASGLLHLEPGALAEDQIRLTVQPFEIAGIMVDGRQRWSTTLQRSGFYERSKLPFGSHLDRSALRRRNSTRVDYAIEHLLRSGCTDGLGDRDGGAAISLGNSGGPIRTQTMGAAGNAPVIFLDGIPYLHVEDLKHLPMDAIEGVEFYKSFSGAPSQYAGWARCGVLLIWTG